MVKGKEGFPVAPLNPFGPIDFGEPSVGINNVYGKIRDNIQDYFKVYEYDMGQPEGTG